MRGLNKVMLIGRLGKDPEMVYFESGSVKASFTLATNEVYKDREGNKVEKTDWHNVVMWRGLAKVAENYLKKGSLVYVEGKLKTRSWDDSNGNKRFITEVEALDLQMLDSRSSDRNNGQNGQSRQQQTVVRTNEKQQANDNGKEDLPF